MIASRHFALFATSVATTLLLIACQPATEDNEVMPIEKATQATNEPSETAPEDAHAGHDIAANDVTVKAEQMSDMLKDYTKSMTSMHNEVMVGMGYNDPDTAFAKGMLGHHRGAVDMAKIELKYGTDETMRKLAQDIIDSQQLEIDILNKWLASHPDAPKPKPNTEAMQEAYAKGMNTMHSDMMLGIAEPVADMAFARGMLPHHIGAVDMAKVQLQYGTDEEMRKLAQDIIDAQQPEIELIQNWIAANKAPDTAITDTDDAVINDKENNKEAIKETINATS
ncbi:CopM family metallochaperone [Psychrobacter faecalis]|uniref:CopM family metallochaperone n=1 Tax=Psychrobacter faecalis TaxID=180588 RepID=UPI003FD1C432